MITDNGIGRVASRQLHNNVNYKNNGNGIGLKNVFRRLSLLEETMKISIHLEVSDLNPGEADTGTMVLVRLPAKFPGRVMNPETIDNIVQIQSKYMTKFMR